MILASCLSLKTLIVRSALVLIKMISTDFMSYVIELCLSLTMPYLQRQKQ